MLNKLSCDMMFSQKPSKLHFRFITLEIKRNVQMHITDSIFENCKKLANSN